MDGPLITLLTDFGLTDVYVGVMKGVIAQVNAALTVIDLTHAIAPQDIALARFHLGTAYPYFPANTVHVIVVDPGVGSQRRAIACQTEFGIFVAPDNGVLTDVLEQAQSVQVVELTRSQYWRTSHPSSTFHGRDIFAPVAAHLASGTPLTAVGGQVDAEQLVHLRSPWRVRGDRLEGTIQAIDHFGNLITTISASIVPETWTVMIGDYPVPSGETYTSVLPGHVVSLIGSHGWLEIAVNGGSARDWLQKLQHVQGKAIINDCSLTLITDAQSAE
jgi:S-adenosyl-L-methionine hydrolase (adenosine-forming)